MIFELNDVLERLKKTSSDAANVIIICTVSQRCWNPLTQKIRRIIIIDLDHHTPYSYKRRRGPIESDMLSLSLSFIDTSKMAAVLDVPEMSCKMGRLDWLLPRLHSSSTRKRIPIPIILSPSRSFWGLSLCAHI